MSNAPAAAGATARPFGSWASSLSPRAAAAGAVRIAATRLDRDVDGRTVLRWSEQRPDQGGRTAVCRAVLGDDSAGGVDEGSSSLSARSGVNEYGGGSWWTHGDRLFWVDGPSQRIHTLDDGRSRAVTPPPPRPRGWRFASGTTTPDGAWIICEREVHPGSDDGPLDEPVNEIVAVRTSGGRPGTLIRVGDFCAAPTVSPDGTSLAWLRWDHPDMPWDSAEVWAASLLVPDGDDSDGVPTVRDARRVAGGAAGGLACGLDRAVAACLPTWSPDGRLWWCDDRDDWWQLRAAPEPGLPAQCAGDLVPATPDVPGEVGEPRWVAGGSRYGFTGDGRVCFVVARDGLDSVQIWDPRTGDIVAAPGPEFTAVEHLSVQDDVIAVAGGAGDLPTSAWTIDLSTAQVTDHRPDVAAPDPRGVSVPRPVSFPTADGEQAHGLFYEPRSVKATGPSDARPPLVVRIHGGPTAAARAEYSTSVQFWTSRGCAVIDVNYRGSTGYGRRYRDLLRDSWGIADVADCVAAARWLAAEGLVDGARCVIRGGSAGGFTALQALCHHDDHPDAFAAACSLYGVTDLMSLVEDTHKFESRYLDGLVGPLPGAADRYRERSPLHHADRLHHPVLLLQGADDPVVPLPQAEVLRDALRAGGVPHALIVFEGEAHGFRRADTIVAALQAELSFYGQVLGFTPADDLRPLHLDR